MPTTRAIRRVLRVTAPTCVATEAMIPGAASMSETAKRTLTLESARNDHMAVARAVPGMHRLPATTRVAAEAVRSRPFDMLKQTPWTRADLRHSPNLPPPRWTGRVGRLEVPGPALSKPKWLQCWCGSMSSWLAAMVVTMMMREKVPGLEDCGCVATRLVHNS